VPRAQLGSVGGVRRVGVRELATTVGAKCSGRRLIRRQDPIGAGKTSGRCEMLVRILGVGPSAPRTNSNPKRTSSICVHGPYFRPINNECTGRAFSMLRNFAQIAELFSRSSSCGEGVRQMPLLLFDARKVPTMTGPESLARLACNSLNLRPRSEFG
jgi:hypothetical protein